MSDGSDTARVAASRTPPRRGLPFQTAFNRCVALLLRSPLHGVASSRLLLLSFVGRRSGKPYTVAITYLRQGSVVCLFARRDLVWWRNLRDGARVTLRLAGRDVPGRAIVVEDDLPRVRERLAAFLRRSRPAGRFYAVPFDAAGEPDPEAVARAAAQHVMVQIELDEGAALA